MLPRIFAEIGLKIDGFERAAGEVSKRLNAIDRDAQRSLSGFKKMGDRLTEVGTSMSIGITAPLVAAGAGALAFAATFESSMNRIRALGDITGKDLEMLKQQALKLGADTKFSAQQAADGMAEFAAAGFNANQIYSVMPGTLSLAAAGAISVADAAKLTKDILGQFRLEASKATEVADVLAKASAESSGSLLELGTSLTYAGPRAADLGISLNTTVAALIELDKAGIRGSEAGTQLRGVLASIVGPSKDAQKYITELGVNVKDTAGNFLPLPNVIEQFRAGLEKLGGGVERAKFLTEIFGREASNAASILINQGGPALEKYTELLDKSNGAADKQAKILNSGLKGAYEELKGSVETAAIALGDVLLPTAVRITNALQKFVNESIIPAIRWFSELPEPVQMVAFAFTAAAAAIGPLTIGLGIFLQSASTVAIAMSSLGKAIMTTVVPQLISFGAAIGNVVYAVGTGMTGALIGGEAALLKFALILGQVALVAGTAFAAFKIGEWAYANIPGVNALGDAIGGLILKIPILGNLITNWGISTEKTLKNNLTLEQAVKNLESTLAKKGIIVERGSKTLQEYAAALSAAAVKSGVLAKASDAEQIAKYKAQIEESKKQAALYAKAQDEVGGKTKKVADAHRDAFKPLESLTLETKLLAARMQTLRGEQSQEVAELDKLTLAIERGKVGTVDWSVELDKLTLEMDALGSASDDITRIKLPAWATEVAKITRPNEDLINALGRLGVKSQEEYKKVADEAAKARDAVLGSGVATDFEKKSAIYKALQAQVEYSKVAGIEITKDQRDMLDQLGRDLDNKLPEQKQKWDTFSKSVSTAISNFSQDIVKSLFEGEGSWAEKGIGALKKLGQAVLTSFVEPATMALTEFLNGVIKDLLGGKGFGGLIDGIKGIGSGIGGIFGGGGGLSAGAGIPSTVPGIGGILSGGGSAAGAAGGAASGAASAASSLLGTLGAVGAIGSFASGIISNFQMSSLNKTMGRVEESTRYTAIAMIGPGGVIDTERTFLPWLEIIGRYLYTVQQPWFVDVSIYLERVIDSLALGYGAAKDSVGMLSDIRGQLEFQNMLALEGAGMGGGLTVNVTGNTFATSGQIDQFVALLTDRIARTIGYK